ncbi:hypothetical protein BDV98DRAFT_563169 [Pterulicium gracile]|uniref:Uncharacterized protein n=1 Tax=Pterulicium gracile TaxID=1884261 RepID=A0A5C3QPE7_9AGAR|nr:hypothetical protein BDV98DRAFT_563169 [Pterula gracilis]
MALPRPALHIMRQLKFVVPGALATYYFDTHTELLALALGGAGLARTTALAVLAIGLLTVTLFVYVLLMPLLRGTDTDFKRWRESGVLSHVIPILTASIVLGWSLLVTVLGLWTDMGVGQGIIGASGLYALTFGLLGLIPAPKIRRS